jgi:phosphoglycerol geranylgeranyltransferase
MEAHSQSPVWNRLNHAAHTQGAALLQLLDPEQMSPEHATETAMTAAASGCDAFLIGGSTGSPDRFRAVCRAVHRAVDQPVVIFPNGAAQVFPDADAILFMSLLSGRNPEYLISQQVKGAPRVAECGLEAIPTAYLLIESGRTSAVEFISGTRPIPRAHVSIARDHALAARYLGLRLLYLEAGSGAPQPVPTEMVRSCAEVGLPLAVGGGIREPQQAEELVAAGVRFVVIGNRFEPRTDWTLFKEFVDAIHTQAHVPA